MKMNMDKDTDTMTGLYTYIDDTHMDPYMDTNIWKRLRNF